MVLLDFALQRLVLTGAHLTQVLAHGSGVGFGFGWGRGGRGSAEEAHMSQFGRAGQGKQTQI